MATCCVVPLLLLLAIHTVATDTHICSHDEHRSKQPPTVTAQQAYSPHHGRHLTVDATRENIRIVFNTDALASATELPSGAASVLVNDILPQAGAAISELLKVTPVSGPLYAGRQCEGYCTSGPNIGVCGGHATTNPTCGSSPSVTIPTSMLGEGWVFDSCTTSSIPSSCTPMPAEAGVADADFVLFVTAEQASSCPDQGATSGTLAFASACQRDQLDRPTFGLANFCPYRVPDSSSPEDISLAVRVAMHEIFHALGFSGDSWPLFRDAETGDPLTPRHEWAPHLASAAFTFEADLPGCTGVSSYLPGTNVIAKDTGNGRGFPCTGANDPGDCPQYFTTEKAVHMAREYFDCPTLPGPEIENQPTTTGCSLAGSHWEQRILEQELMSPVLSDGIDFEVSGITLGLMEDTGWYTANYSAGTHFVRGRDWGYKQGCTFATEPCLSSAQESLGSPPHFCTDQSSFGSQAACTLDARTKGFCFAGAASGTPAGGYQYADGAGGFILALDTPQRDYCPIHLPFSTGSCTDPANLPSGNARGETFGPDSFCMLGSVVSTSFVNPNSIVSLCVDTSCSAGVLTVSVGGRSAVCAAEGDTVTFSGYTGSVVCPDPTVICATPEAPYIPPWVYVAPSATPSLSMTPTVSTSVTPTPSVSDSTTPSTSLSPTETPTQSITGTPSPSLSVTPTNSLSGSTTSTATATPSVTPTRSRPSPSSTNTPTPTPTPSPPIRIDCVVSSTFSAWTACVGLPCASEGSQSRQRDITVFPAGLGTACPTTGLLETRTCSLIIPTTCPSCDNGDLDSGEIDIDCGTAECGGCGEGRTCSTNAHCASGLICGSGSCVLEAAATVETYLSTSLRLVGASPSQISSTELGLFKDAVVAQTAQHGVTVSPTDVLVLGVAGVSSGTRRLSSAGESVDVLYAVATSSSSQADAVSSVLESDGTGLGLRVQQSLQATLPTLETVEPAAAAPSVLSTTSDPLVVQPDGDDSSSGGVSVVVIAVAAVGVTVVAVVAAVVASRHITRKRAKKLKAMSMLEESGSAPNRVRAIRAALAASGPTSPAALGERRLSTQTSFVNPLTQGKFAFEPSRVDAPPAVAMGQPPRRDSGGEI